MNCRHCGSGLHSVFLDLGFAPPSNAYVSQLDLKKPEVYYPLKLFVCEDCWLVQTEDYAKAEELFSEDYAYFSSVSIGWLAHAANYVDIMVKRLALGRNSLVVEIASNDGYLLKNFVALDIPCLGIEPTASTASVAEKNGIPVLREFFGKQLAEKLVSGGKKANLIVANNVYAHVPDINDFTLGLKKLLQTDGTITLEFPHLVRLIEQNLFDTVYHEHFSYLSLYSVNQIFDKANLRILDVEELPTHGGSLRVYGCHQEDSRSTTHAVAALMAEELRWGMRSLRTYSLFQSRADRVKNDLLSFLIEQKRLGRKVVGYGAAAKGCTLLNYAGVKPDLLPFIADAAESKQGKFLPGVHVPIKHPDMILESRPDVVLILPWNIRAEVMHQLSFIREWGGQFAVALPSMQIL
jgi:hypothetical protein